MVVAIIGVLVTMVMGSLNSARSKARDAQRERDVQTIKNALEIYHLDNGYYPSTSWTGSHTSKWADLETMLETSLPKDPLNTSSLTNQDAAKIPGNYVYSYYGTSAPTTGCSGQAYMLVYNKENSIDNDPESGVRLCDGVLRIYGDAFVTGISPLP